MSAGVSQYNHHNPENQAKQPLWLLKLQLILATVPSSNVIKDVYYEPRNEPPGARGTASLLDFVSKYWCTCAPNQGNLFKGRVSCL